MSEINWNMYNVPNYDMDDIRKSRELAFNTQANVADKIEKDIRERREQEEKDLKLKKLLKFAKDNPKIADTVTNAAMWYGSM